MSAYDMEIWSASCLAGTNFYKTGVSPAGLELSASPQDVHTSHCANQVFSAKEPELEFLQCSTRKDTSDNIGEQ